MPPSVHRERECQVAAWLRGGSCSGSERFPRSACRYGRRRYPSTSPDRAGLRACLADQSGARIRWRPWRPARRSMMRAPSVQRSPQRWVKAGGLGRRTGRGRAGFLLQLLLRLIECILQRLERVLLSPGERSSQTHDCSGQQGRAPFSAMFGIHFPSAFVLGTGIHLQRAAGRISPRLQCRCWAF